VPERRAVRKLASRAAALAALAVLGTAPAAKADHLTAAVSATATLGTAAKFCMDEGDPCARGRRVSVSWQASCGPAAPPDAIESIDVSIVGIRPDRTRFTVETFTSFSREPSGSEGTTVGPGLRFAGEVTVTCRTFTGSVEHLSTATGSSAELYVPPQVKAAQRVFPIISSCRLIPTSKLDKWLQRGRKALLTWQISYYEESLLAPGIPEAGQITLFARGAGIRLKRSPNRTILRRYRHIGLPVTPPRAGTLRIWARVNGHRSTTFAVKVLPC
jgi:hypothetical protein